MSTTTTAIVLSDEFAAVLDDFENTMNDEYLGPDENGVAPTDEAEITNIKQTSAHARQLAATTLVNFITDLEGQVEALKAALETAQQHVVPTAVATAPSSGGGEPFNAKKHNAYQCFVQRQVTNPDPTVVAAQKANGDWSKTVGAIWKAKTKADQDAFFAKWRQIVWPNVNFGQRVVAHQSRSAYNFFQMSLKGQKKSSADVSAMWKSMTDAQKAPFVQQSTNEKRGLPAGTPAAVTAVATSAISATTAVAAPGGVKVGTTPYNVFQQENSGKGLTQKQIGEMWRALNDAQKKTYETKLNAQRGIVA